MSWFWSNRRLFIYMLAELIPSFLLGVFVFIFILLMFQALRLTEFLLVHGVSTETILDIVVYMSVSFLPALLPMSLIFAVLMTYIRLSGDSEIVAMRALGSNNINLIAPALCLGCAIALLSFYTSFFIGPWGNRKFEVLINDLSHKKAGATIREGSFSEGFFDMVIYANKADSKTGILQKVFIYDERNNQKPVTIIAKEGKLIQDDSHSGNFAYLQLHNGSLHRSANENSTLINFQTYSINLVESSQNGDKKKSLPSLNFYDLQEQINKALPPEPKTPDAQTGWKLLRDKKNLAIFEFHKRFAIAFACILFALLGVSFGMKSNRRSSKSSGFVMSLGIIVGYWALFVASDNLVKSYLLPPALGGWLASILFGIVSFKKLRNLD